MTLRSAVSSKVPRDSFDKLQTFHSVTKVQQNFTLLSASQNAGQNATVLGANLKSYAKLYLNIKS